MFSVQFRANGAFTMLDILFLAAGLVFFIVSAGYAAGCERL